MSHQGGQYYQVFWLLKEQTFRIKKAKLGETKFYSAFFSDRSIDFIVVLPGFQATEKLTATLPGQIPLLSPLRQGDRVKGGG